LSCLSRCAGSFRGQQDTTHTHTHTHKHTMIKSDNKRLSLMKLNKVEKITIYMSFAKGYDVNIP